MIQYISLQLRDHQFEFAMKINVAQQLKESVGSVRHITIDEIDSAGLPIRGEVQLLRTNHSILVSGRLNTTVRDVCGRCLEEFDYPLTLDIEEEYLLAKDLTSGTPLTPPTESGAFTIEEDNTLDLSEAVRQYTLLAQPLKPICREDCAGLCPQCGCNLNHETCHCTPIRHDSPWAPLQGLLSGAKQRVDTERSKPNHGTAQKKIR